MQVADAMLTVNERLTRSDLLRRAGVAAATAAVAGAVPRYAFAGPLRYAGRLLAGKLSIVQWSHVFDSYDAWLEKWATAWGERNDVAVAIDHVDYTRLPALAASEVKAQRGHDVFGFLSPPAVFEDQVIDHRDVIREVERRVGAYGSVGRRSTYNPKTKRFVGVSDSHVLHPTIWRHDLWSSIGESPTTWEHVRAAAPKLRALGHPIGIGQSYELDSNIALLALLTCFGSFVQDESNRLTIRSRETVEAVRFMAGLFRSGGDAVTLDWNPTSNNAYLLDGKGSLVMNAISVIRTAEKLGLPFVNDLRLSPVPKGPVGRLDHPQYTNVYAIWSFAKNKDAAERFIADLCVAYEEATVASQLFNHPSFPGAFPADKLTSTAAADPALPRGKYATLTTIASKHVRNVGYPGTTNAAVVETLDRFLIPRMFAEVSRGNMSAEESVRATEYEMKRIWRRWRAAGKV